MSLYTVTFEDSDDPQSDVAPVPIDVKVSPPRPVDVGQGYRRRRINKDEHNTPTVVTKEKVDVNNMQTRNNTRKHVTAEEEEEINIEKPPEEQEQKPKRTRIKRYRNKASSADHSRDETQDEIVNKPKPPPEVKEDEEHSDPDEPVVKTQPVVENKTNIKTPQKEEVKETENDPDLEEEENELVKQLNQLISNDSNLLSYRFQIENKITLRGKRIHFQLTREGNPLYHSKIKSRTGIEQIFISKGTECHLSDTQFEGVILVGAENRSFSLRKQNRYTDDIVSVKFTQNDSDKKPRTMSVHFFGSGLPTDLYTRPFIFRDGIWLIRVKNRTATQSIKNCVLVDKKDNEWVIILKKDDDVLSIEAAPEIDPLIVFTLGAASYICK